MFYVVEFYGDDPSVEVTLFRSYTEHDCWRFIRSRLEHYDYDIRQYATNLYVTDSVGALREPPADVSALYNFVKLAV